MYCRDSLSQSFGATNTSIVVPLASIIPPLASVNTHHSISMDQLETRDLKLPNYDGNIDNKLLMFIKNIFEHCWGYTR